MNNQYYFYPVWVRIWHWSNALLFLILVVTGLSMQYSNPDNPFITFQKAVEIHNFCGVLLIINYAMFLIGNFTTHNHHYYWQPMQGLMKRIRLQAHYYLSGYFKKEAPPYPLGETRKFNPLQQIAYVLVMYVLMPLIILTGTALLFPETIIPRIFNTSGILITAILHMVSGFILSLFLCIHIYFGTMGAKKMSHFRSMFTGYHESH